MCRRLGFFFLDILLWQHLGVYFDKRSLGATPASQHPASGSSVLINPDIFTAFLLQFELILKLLWVFNARWDAKKGVIKLRGNSGSSLKRTNKNTSQTEAFLGVKCSPQDAAYPIEMKWDAHHCCQTRNVFDRVLHFLLGHFNQHTTVVILGRKRLSTMPRHPWVHLDTKKRTDAMFFPLFF